MKNLINKYVIKLILMLFISNAFSLEKATIQFKNGEKLECDVEQYELGKWVVIIDQTGIKKIISWDNIQVVVFVKANAPQDSTLSLGKKITADSIGTKENETISVTDTTQTIQKDSSEIVIAESVQDSVKKEPETLTIAQKLAKREKERKKREALEAQKKLAEDIEKHNQKKKDQKKEAEPVVSKTSAVPDTAKTKEEKFKEEIREENKTQKPEIDINKKTGKVGVEYYQTLESDAARRCWLEEGGRLMTKGFTVNYVYTSMDMDEMDSDFSMHGFGYTGSMYYKWLNPPSYDLGKSMWTSPGVGFTGSTNVTFGSMSMNSAYYEMDMDLIMISIELSVPCGYTFGLGKFLSRSDWKGVMLGVFWKPSYNITSTTTTITSDYYTSTSDPVTDGALNLTGLQWTIDYGSFSDLAEGLAQEAHLSINGFILPETDNTPFMFSIGLGMIWY